MTCGKGDSVGLLSPDSWTFRAGLGFVRGREGREWTEPQTEDASGKTKAISAQVMLHKPSAIAEKHDRHRPLDLLRAWHVRIESWILEQAGIKPPGEGQATGLWVVASRFLDTKTVSC